jgi:hypothetical protein
MPATAGSGGGKRILWGIGKSSGVPKREAGCRKEQRGAEKSSGVPKRAAVDKNTGVPRDDIFSKNGDAPPPPNTRWENVFAPYLAPATLSH